MVAEAKPVGGQRYRESYGRYLEDFKVGDVYEHRPGRTITETDNTWFTLLTMNQHPLHFDKAYAEASEFGRVLVNSCLTLSLVTGMSVSDVSQKTVANLGWNDVRLTGPVFVGDTIYAESEVVSIRESRSRPNQGIVTIRSRGLNQGGQEVIRFERTMLIPARGYAVDDRIGY
jgi:itaconyl-CoA hydratase